MSFAAASGLVLFTVIAMFALVFVLAGVESRMFDDVMVTPEVDEAAAPVAAVDLEPVVELGRAA